jgi:hypothetical protein
MCAPMLALGVLSAGMSAIGAIQAGNAQSQAAKTQQAQAQAQSELQHRQAVIQQTTAQYEERQKGEQADTLMAQQRNAFAGTGLTLDGSPTDVMIDSHREAALDVEAIQWNSRLKASNLDFEGGISSMNADAARRAAKTAQTTGYINAATGFVGGVSRAFSPQSTSGTNLGLKF